MERKFHRSVRELRPYGHSWHKCGGYLFNISLVMFANLVLSFHMST